MIHNCYKRQDVFVCRHDSHRGFDHRVSAHHVLCEKRCYPEGCVTFDWNCKLLDKGGTCPKGYQHVGTNCGQCRHYDEEKIQRYPELQLSKDEYREFLEECRTFDEWLQDHAGRRYEAGGTLTGIQPHLVKRIDGRRTRLSLRGFLLRMHPAFVGRDGLADSLYARISAAQQRRHGLASGDRLELEGPLDLDRGRLVIHRPRRIHVEDRAGAPPARWDHALLDRSEAVSLAGQPERCLRCERGVLVDVEEPGGRRRGRPRREMLCLEGIGRPAECPFEALRALRSAR